MNQKHPIYQHPPVVEMHLEMTIQQLPVNSVSWLEELMSIWGREWKIASQQEQQLKLVNLLQDRYLHVSAEKLAFHWSGWKGAPYPHYENVRDGFIQVSAPFLKQAEFIARFNPSACQVSYVNRLPRGTVWETPGEWKFLRCWQPVKLLEPGICNHYSQSTSYTLASGKTLQTSLNYQTEAEIVLVALQCNQILPPQSEFTDVLEALDGQRELIVRTFHEMMSFEANKYWGYLNSDS